jgi:CHAT domain-containing protein/tetratricopeptide (TPR) repeat protein
MSPSPVSCRSASPIHRGALGLLAALIAVLLCCAEGPAPQTSAVAERPAIEREIQGNETHVYPFELQAGQFLRVVVEENGVKLALRLLDPEGAVVTGADVLGTDHPDAAEDLAAVAATTGPHRLEVTASGERSGRYLMRTEGPRTPSQGDRMRTEAVQATWDALTSEIAAEDRIGSLERALALWRQVGDPEKPSEVLFRLGLLRNSEPLNAYAQALEDFQQSAADRGRQTDRRSRVFQTDVLTHVGRCLRNLHRPEEARGAHDQALALARELGENRLQGENLNLLGRLADDEGEIQQALDLRHQALKKAKQAGDRQLESRVLNNLGLGYRDLGEMEEALKLFEEALSLARVTSNRKDEIGVLINLGGTYRVLGNWEEAFARYKTALEMIGAISDRKLAAKILINLAEVYRHRRELTEARDSLNRALALGHEIEDREIQVFALANLALVLRPDQPQQAADLAREAVGLGGLLEQRAFSRYALGSVLQDLGDKASARTELLMALDFAGRRGDRGREAQINLALAHLYRETDDLVSAVSRLRAVIELIESWRGGVVDPEVKTSFLASTQEVYELQVNTLMALHAQKPTDGLAAEALRVSEQARARGLLEILNEAGAKIHLEADPALLEKEHELGKEVSAADSYRKKLLGEENPNAAKLAEAEQRLKTALDRYQRVQRELRQSNPRYAALTQPQPLSLEEIQQQVLDGGALLLEYSLGTEKSFLWAVTADSFASFELPGRARIEEAARRYYELLTVRSNRPSGEEGQAWINRRAAADAEAKEVARGLSRLILRPVEPLLGDRPLLIVADGALQYVPFAALPVPSTGAPLASAHDIVSLPSASVLAILRRELQDRQRSPRALAIFANPVFQVDDDRLLQSLGQLEPPESEERRRESVEHLNFPRLRYSQREADAITDLLPREEVFQATDFAASRATVMSSPLHEFRIVHFATHGLIDSHDPELSGLVMSRYGENGEPTEFFLSLGDIYSLRLGADLVVLSACQTALGKEIRGEGLVGLTRGFMYAGAARVVASLWSVDDRSTAELMASFYRGMIREGLSPAAALRQAQRQMASKWKHPYYWAGFSLQGEWR